MTTNPREPLTCGEPLTIREQYRRAYRAERYQSFTGWYYVDKIGVPEYVHENELVFNHTTSDGDAGYRVVIDGQFTGFLVYADELRPEYV